MRVHFKFESASAEVNFVQPDLAFVNNVYSRERRQGHATGVMTRIVDFADEKQVCLLLMAQASDRHGMDNWQLEDFYIGFGFERQSNTQPIRMRREPRRFYMAHSEKETV